MITWRKDPFVSGARYRVRKAFTKYEHAFREAEVLSYRGSAYSHYDSASDFQFTDAEGKIRVWEMHDEEPIEVWSQLFEKIDEKA